jgi:hypothetical protein
MYNRKADPFLAFPEVSRGFGMGNLLGSGATYAKLACYAMMNRR